MFIKIDRFLAPSINATYLLLFQCFFLLIIIYNLYNLFFEFVLI